MADIINLYIEKLIWPDALKADEFIPLYKTTNKYDGSNYRSISTTSDIVKICEKMIHNRVFNFVLECYSNIY